MRFFIEMRESVISFRFFSEIRKSRYGKVFGYLALLLLLTYTLSGVKAYIDTNQLIDIGSAYVQNNIPEFSVTKDGLDWKGQPVQYFVQDKDVTIAVDVNGTLDRETLAKENQTYIIFTKDTMIAKNMMKKEMVSYKDMSANFTKADLLKLIEGGRIFIVILLVLFFPFYYGYKLLNVLLLACIAAMAAAILKLKITWKETFIISGYALTLPILLALLFMLAGVSFPGMVYWLISIVYVVMGLRYVRMEEDALAEKQRQQELEAQRIQFVMNNKPEERSDAESMEAEPMVEKVEPIEKPYQVTDGNDTEKKNEE